MQRQKRDQRGTNRQTRSGEQSRRGRRKRRTERKEVEEKGAREGVRACTRGKLVDDGRADDSISERLRARRTTHRHAQSAPL
jgi:hypothetical protein